ncbi:TetR/AcrR family transcriptional regulator [Nitratidesulfovibrio sp.]|uniref:TetR/AcrR family transcriptional regulator n=1 Tax=Nitratidesulfovibrio sp. TaxID=2802297 RepID=UPI003340E494
MDAPAPKKRPRGRPRCDASRTQILEATNALLEEVGYARLTMEGIAARAGVSKATLYRWWPGKGAVAMEAFMHATNPRIDFPHTDSAVADVTAQMHLLAAVYRGVTGRLVRELIGLGQGDPQTLAAFVESYLLPRRAAAKDVLRRGIARGELRPDLDLDLLVDALYAPIFHRLLLQHGPLDDAFIRAVAATAFASVVLPR